MRIYSCEGGSIEIGASGTPYKNVNNFTSFQPQKQKAMRAFARKAQIKNSQISKKARLFGIEAEIDF